MILDTTSYWAGALAKKTKGLKAKHLSALFADKSVMSKFLLDTLEAKEVITPDACFCIGEANDAWQQSAVKLIKDYDLVSIDADGWMLWHPKPTKIVEFIEVTPEMGEGYIVGKWGQTIDGVANLQKFKAGDFIARQPGDHSDQWVIQRSIWQRTYSDFSCDENLL